MRYRDGRRSVCVSSQSGLPADVHVLRHGRDEVRPQPDRVGDPRPGAALPPHRAGRPPRVHGDGRADDEPRPRARGGAAAARRRHHAPADRHLHGRLGAGDPAAGARRDMPIRLALSLHAPEDALRSKIMPVNDRYPLARGARGVRGVLRPPPPDGLRRVRDARGRQRRLRPGRAARAAARPAEVQAQPDPLQPDGLDLRRLLAGGDRRLQGRAGGARPEGDRAPDAGP